MKILTNEGSIDRIVRLFLAEILVISGYFWLGGVLATICITLGTVLAITAFTGFCGVYTLFGIKTCPIEKKKLPLWIKLTSALLFIAIAVAGSYYSVFFTKKFFLEDYNVMNNSYKQTLFLTGQNNRDEASANYALLVADFKMFSDKYAAYHPYSVKFDTQFNSDLQEVGNTIASLKDIQTDGDLQQAHLELESIRPIFQEILKRNGFSMLATVLVDFHDVMETVLDAANEKDVQAVEEAYLLANEKLLLVEEVANDEEIQNIRAKLEAVKSAAQNGNLEELPALGGELKSAFVKVYLKRG